MKHLFFLTLLLFISQFASAQNIDECRKIVEITIESIGNQSTKHLNEYLADDFSMAGRKGEIAKRVLSQLLSQLDDNVKTYKETKLTTLNKELELKYDIEYEKMGIKEATFTFNENNLLKGLELFKIEVKTMSNKSEIVKSSKSLIEVPFEMANKLIAVDVVLNGIQRKFILDSGSPKTLLNSHYIMKDSTQRSISSLKGVAGNISGMDIEKVSSLDFNGIQLNNQDIITMDLTHLEEALEYEFYGLIGYDFIKDYDVIFDYKKLTITLIDPDTYEEYRNKILLNSQLEIVAFELKKHIPVIQANINGKTLKFGIDSGAEANLIDDDLFQTLKKATRKIQTDEMVGADNNRKKVKKGDLKRMTIGNKPFKKLFTSFSDISHLNNGYQLSLDGLIGYPVLSNQKTLISYSRKELIFIE